MYAHILTPEPLVINTSQPMALHNSFYRWIDPWNILVEQHRSHTSPCAFLWVFGSAVTHFPRPTDTGGIRASVFSIHSHQWESYCEPSHVRSVFITKQLLLPTRHIPHILQQTGATGVTVHLTLGSSLVSVVTNSLGEFVVAMCLN